MSFVTTSPDGATIDVDSLPQALHYTAGVMDYVEVTVGAVTYRQTYTYTAGELTGVSGWVKQ